MEVLRGIRGLHGDLREDIAVRSITKKFWQTCIDTVDKIREEGNIRPYRVAAVGTPGIGKTTSTSILIRMLLETNKTVVYHIRAPNNVGWFYVIISRDGWYNVNVYPEWIPKDAIPQLKQATTYYIVDPGETKLCCNPAPRFLPKVIIVASDDERHWGSGFTKYRLGGEGVFLHYPVWSLEELVAARPIIAPELAETALAKRYRLFGGVPKNILCCPDTLLQTQENEVDLLTRTQLEKIAAGRIDVLGSHDPTRPGRSLVAYDLPLDREGKRIDRFDEYRVIFASPAVEESVSRVVRKFLTTLGKRFRSSRYRKTKRRRK
jgi:hypothetical protein